MPIAIRHHDRQELEGRVTWRIPAREGWLPWSFGGVRSVHHFSEAQLAASSQAHETDRPCIGEVEFELDVEWSIIESLPGPTMTVLELGAGWGAQAIQMCLAVRHDVLEARVRQVECYLCEPEPGHYGFMLEALQANEVRATPIYGAVSDRLGWGRLQARADPADSYGQRLQAGGNLDVPVFTPAYLVEAFDLREIDILHADIQGSEPQALRGGLPVLDRFRTILVCPHEVKHVEEIAWILNPTHDLLLSFPPRSGYHEVPGFPLPVHMPQDGLMVWERRGD